MYTVIWQSLFRVYNTFTIINQHLLLMGVIMIIGLYHTSAPVENQVAAKMNARFPHWGSRLLQFFIKVNELMNHVTLCFMSLACCVVARG